MAAGPPVALFAYVILLVVAVPAAFALRGWRAALATALGLTLVAAGHALGGWAGAALALLVLALLALLG